jgi:predicted ArsR family transcriptional regulator
MAEKILELLRRRAPLFSYDIAKELGVPVTDVQDTMDVLERRKLVFAHWKNYATGRHRAFRGWELAK